MDYKDMFKNYKGENPHKEIDWGEDVGKERFWEDTLQAIKEIEDIKSGITESKSYSNADELFKDLGI